MHPYAGSDSFGAAVAVESAGPGGSAQPDAASRLSEEGKGRKGQLRPCHLVFQVLSRFSAYR